MDLPLYQTTDNSITKFLHHIDALDTSLKRFEEDLQHIEKYQRRAMDQHLPDEEITRNKEYLEKATKDSQGDSTAYRKHFTALEKHLTCYAKGSSDYIMCANQLSKLQKKYYQLLNRFHLLQKNYTRKQKERLLKELQVMDPSATEEHLNTATSHPIFKQAMLQSMQYSADRALTQVKERHQEVRRLEQSVEELAEMMAELGLHIQQQDTFVDMVIQQSVDAMANLESGDKQIEEAIQKRRSSLRWKWCLFICVLLVLLGVALYVSFGVLKVHQPQSDTNAQVEGTGGTPQIANTPSTGGPANGNQGSVNPQTIPNADPNRNAGNNAGVQSGAGNNNGSNNAGNINSANNAGNNNGGVTNAGNNSGASNAGNNNGASAGTSASPELPKPAGNADAGA